ncbi:unnamed protein product [Lepidochelys olivacea]
MRMTGLVLREPELRLVLSAYADDVLLVVQDPGDLARVEACQAIYSAASSARVNWVKSSGLAVGDWWQLLGRLTQGQAKAWFQGLFWLIGVHLKNLSKRPNTYTIPSPSSFPAGAYYHIPRSAAVVSAHIFR